MPFVTQIAQKNGTFCPDYDGTPTQKTAGPNV